jgi:hypothetical protein
MPEEEVYEH